MAFRDDFLNTIQTLESNGVQGRTSSKGATGRMQTMKATRTDPGFGVMPARDNSLEEGDRVGRDYALALLDHYNDPAIALAAYNAGPGAVNKHGGIPPYRETQNYVRKGMAMLDEAQAPVNLTPEQEAEFEKYYAQQQEEQKPVELTPEQDAEFEKYYAEQQGGEAKEPEGRSVGTTLKDIGISAEKGGINAVQSLIGLADLAAEPFDKSPSKYIAENVYDLSKKQAELSEEYSPQQKAANKALSEASGITENLLAMRDYPSAVGASLMGTAPSIVAGGLMGKIAKTAGVVSDFIAAGIGEGAIGAGGAASQATEQAPDKELTTKTALSSLGSGAVTGVLGGVMGKATVALGGMDPTQIVMGNTRRKLAAEMGEEAASSPGVFRQVVTSALGEGVFEEAPQSAQEQMWQNYSSDRPLTEGVEDAAIKGGMLGTIMGGGAGAISARSGQAAEQPAVTPSAPAPTPTPAPTAEGGKLTEEDKVSALAGMGLASEEQLYNELVNTDINSLEGLARAEEIVHGRGAKLPDNFDYEQFDNLIASQRDKLSGTTAEPTPEATATTPENKYSVEQQKISDRYPDATPTQKARLDMPSTKAVKVIPELLASARKVARGEATNADHQAVINKYKPVTPYNYVPTPETDENMALGLKEVDKIAKLNQPIAEGEVVDSRLDIPAYTRDEEKGETSAWVPTLHTKDRGTIHRSTVILNNFTMKMPEQGALNIATRKETINAKGEKRVQNKAPIATIRGEWENHTPEQAYAEATKVMDDYNKGIGDWRQAGMDPDRHSHFYDRETQQPIVGGDRMIQIGPLVLVKNPIRGAKAKEDYLYSTAPTEATTGHTTASLSKALSPELKRLVASGKAVIHDTQATLPGENHPANVKGMTTAEGVTHYVANKLTPSTMESVALHEVGVHAGMEKMLGKELWEDVKNQALNGQGKEFDRARAAVPASTPAHLKAEETLAYLVEHSPQLSLVRRIVAAIRNFMRSKMGANIRLSEADARQMAVASMRREATTAERTAREETAYTEKARYALTPESQASLTEAETRRAASEAKSNPVRPKKSFGKSISDGMTTFETAAFSYDAAYIKTLKEQFKKLGLSNKATTELLLQASQSQTVHASSLSAQAAILGKLVKNLETQMWEATSGEHSIANIQPLLDAIAKQHGLTTKQVRNQFGDIMVASRIKEIRDQVGELESIIEDIKNEFGGATKEEIVKLERSLKYHERKLVKAEELAARPQHMTDAQVATALVPLRDHPEYMKPLQEWQDVRKYMVEFLKSTGRYSNDQARAYLDAIAYVPFNRIMDMKDPDEGFLTMAEGHGTKLTNLTAGQKEYKMKGSLSREVDDIVTNMEKWVYASFNKGINADKGRQLVDLASTYFSKGTVTKLATGALTEGAVPIYRDGVKEYWRFEDPLMPYAFNGVNPVALPALRFGAKFANRLRQSIVLNPLFTISQLPQDTFSAMFSSGLKNPFMLPIETLKEFVTTLTGTSKTHQLLKNVGATGQRDPMDMYTQSIHDLAYNQHSDKKGVGASIMRVFNAIAGAGDNALRQAVYNRTVKELKNNPNAKAIAQERAFEIINFRRRGASATIDMIRQITPFLGAYLQAQRVAFNVLSLRGIAPTERKAALATLASTTAQVIAMTFIYNALLGDDDEFKKKDARDKDTRLYPLGSKTNITLPIRPDLFSLPFVMSNHAYNYIADNGVEHPHMAMKSIQEAVIASMVGMPMGPTIIKPILEVSIKHDFFTGKGIIPRRLEGQENQNLYTNKTSELAKMVGSTGLVAPMLLDHFIKGTMGYTGSAILQVTDMALRAGLDIPYVAKDVLGKDVRDIPGVPSLYTNEKAVPYMDNFYTLSAEVNEKFKTLAGLKALKKTEDVKAYKAENKVLLNAGLHSQLNNMSERINTLEKKKRVIAETPNSKMSPDVKRAKIDTLDLKIAHVMKGVPKLERKAYK